MSELSPRRKKLAFTVIATVTSIVILEVAATILILGANRFAGERFETRRSILESQDRLIDEYLDAPKPRLVLDSVLGWRYRAGYMGAGDTLNSRGLRGLREYAESAPPGVVRLAAFGDSFVYCSEVAPPDCWTAQLEAGWTTEVLNFGVGGYGTDQGMLRYLHESRERSPAPTILIGFAPVNVRRNVNRYRRFISPNDGLLFKPRFVLDPGDTLRLIPPPVRDTVALRAFQGNLAALRRAGRQDYWYEPLIYANPLLDFSATVRLASWSWAKFERRYIDPDRIWRNGGLNPSSTLFSLQLRLLREFSDSVAARGSSPYIVIFPDRDSWVQDRMGGPTRYAPLLDSLATSALRVIDLIEAFDESSSDLYTPGGHFTPTGNAAIARHLAARLDLSERR